jgi:tRNA dimethylallyltransferase
MQIGITNLAARRAILIAGPTASGKSAIGLRLARRLNGVIVNADSMQVYAEMRVLTARPEAADERAVPHRLYGHVSARENYSVARWLEDVRRVLAEIEQLGQRPVFVGGTGLYFNALTQGLSPMPEIHSEVRAYWRAEAHGRTPGELHDELVRLDPLTASRIRPSDRQRTVRALEVIQSTGRPLALWQADAGTPLLPAGSWRGLVIAPERAELYARAEARFDQMMATGALEEVRRLREMQLDPELPAMRALGVSSLMEHLVGGVSLEAAGEVAKTQTRQYIKRQLTWLRRYMISWKWISEK